ncbi:MAG: hypothetical protein H7Y88_05295 [Phycisphaerales bacterium]|nr:hypothetical protein [Phycisphaerales bacterium]
MRQEFLTFLGDEGILSAATLRGACDCLRSPPEPLGAIAFNYGMITGADIDMILAEQRGTKRLFGEIALSMGILTKGQVESLVRIQQMRSAVGVAEALLLSGVFDAAELMGELGRFLSVYQHKSVIAGES